MGDMAAKLEACTRNVEHFEVQCMTYNSPKTCLNLYGEMIFHTSCGEEGGRQNM